MKTITKPQIQKIHILLGSLGISEQKAEIIYNHTEGRTESSKELTLEEARQLIMKLAEYDPKERTKSLIFSLAYQAGIIYGSTADDKKINAAKLNLFLLARGAVKKELNGMSYAELVKTHRQFEAIVRNCKKSQGNKEAKSAVNGLLDELGLTVK